MRAATEKLFIDMSTVEPETVIALAKNVRARGGLFVDCPVGGTVGPAREGKLLAMAGGAEASPLPRNFLSSLEHDPENWRMGSAMLVYNERWCLPTKRRQPAALLHCCTHIKNSA